MTEQKPLTEEDILISEQYCNQDTMFFCYALEIRDFDSKENLERIKQQILQDQEKARKYDDLLESFDIILKESTNYRKKWMDLLKENQQLKQELVTCPDCKDEKYFDHNPNHLKCLQCNTCRAVGKITKDQETIYHLRHEINGLKQLKERLEIELENSTPTTQWTKSGLQSILNEVKKDG